MGPCNSVNHSKPPQTVQTSQTPRTESQTFNPEDIPIPIINRLSKRIILIKSKELEVY